MTIERLDPDIKLPFDEQVLLHGTKQDIAGEWLELVKTLDERLEKLTTVVNYGVDFNDGEALYLGLKTAAGRYPTGTWRWIKVGKVLEAHRKETDTGDEDVDWVKVASHSR